MCDECDLSAEPAVVIRRRNGHVEQLPGGAYRVVVYVGASMRRDRADEADEGVAVGEDADDFASPNAPHRETEVP